MRILLVHNYYGSSAPSGEDAVFRQERALLESAGHVTAVFERHNDDFADAGPARLVMTGLQCGWSSRTSRARCGHSQRDCAFFGRQAPRISTSSRYSSSRGTAIRKVLRDRIGRRFVIHSQSCDLRFARITAVDY